MDTRPARNSTILKPKSCHTPIAAIVMVMEMTGSYGLIVPLMIVCMSAYLVGAREGLIEEQVPGAADSPAHAGDAVVGLLERVRVHEAMRGVWPAVVERCTFEAMREGERRLGKVDMIFEGGLKSFVFKGTNGRWCDVLTADELAAYERRVAAMLPPDCAAWLAAGRRALAPSN